MPRYYVKVELEVEAAGETSIQCGLDALRDMLPFLHLPYIDAVDVVNVDIDSTPIVVE